MDQLGTGNLPNLYVTTHAVPTNTPSRPQTAPQSTLFGISNNNRINDSDDVDTILRKSNRNRDPRLAESDGFLVEKGGNKVRTQIYSRKNKTYNLENIVKSPKNIHGLTQEAVNDKKVRNSLKTGIAFLRATSKNSKIYDDVKAVRRKRSSKSLKGYHEK